MTKSVKPKWDREEVLRKGADMHALAVEYRPRVEPRVAAGLIDGMTADLEALRGETSSAVAKRMLKLTETLTQDAALAEGHELVSGYRSAIKRVYPSKKEVQRAFGVGGKVMPGVVSSVANALSMLEAGYARFPGDARAVGLLPEDIELARALRQKLLGADATQEKSKRTSKDATAQRDAAQVRVEQAMDRLAAVAEVVFVKEPAVRDKFLAALPVKKKKKVRVG